MATESPNALPALQSRRTEPKGEVRRAALLEALETLLQERDLAKISVGQIASRAGLTRSAFYFYFSSKEAAVTELLREVWAGMVDGAQKWNEGTDDPRAALGDALRGTTELWRRHRRLILALLDAQGDPAVRELYDSWIELFVEPLAGTVDAERRRGRAPQDGPPADMLVRLLLGMNERALERHVRRDEDEAQAAALAEAITQTWLLAIYGTKDP
ncbi:MAG: TetR/AcrR family transcriptional regulator [Solirubrobacteraceae bacterium]|nr:TetR/AcrR family transcriptional regulator [Solirubrobacteraceae bacterium]